ncbi:hypothetical protein MARHY1886 [Marinobacter nauticus ATCC 49840]|uniref:hypothetical protein n=1 Tax=Marinobacter nauticus TaxID=2743 RepID=UPI000256E87A|nr:hypothetical protein [Marinobacter nauticus]CCG95363.1 hypothetical protein MARHY1886 [Marinobacter nauticus ATCC 49840]
MKHLIDRLPDIINAAARSSRGVISLMVIVFATVAYLFFRHSPEVWRFGSLALFFVGCLGFGFAAYREARSTVPNPDNQNSNIDVSLRDALERWLEEAETARAAKTVSWGSPLPTELTVARTAFGSKWREASLHAKKQLDPVRAATGLAYLTRLYRLEESDSPTQTNAQSWSNEAIVFAEEIQNPELLTDALVDKAAIYLDLAQLGHTDKTKFEQIAKVGDSLVTRAYQTATLAQKSEVLRMASRFYYNLARPQSFRLSDAWDNNYLLLAYEKAVQAKEFDSASLRNANQLARVVIKASKNPPQDREPEWTKRLRDAKNAFKQAWDANSDDLRTVADRLSPLHVLGVITLETVAREWNDSPKSERQSIGRQLRAELDIDSLAQLREAAALLEHSELRTSYCFDIYYDIARSLAVKTGILNLILPNDADVVFMEVKRNIEAAKEAARTPQIEAALRDLDKEITFSFLLEEQRRTLTRILSVSAAT